MIETTSRLHGRTVVDAEGTRLGRVGHVYRSTAESRPSWFTVGSGRRMRFIPAILATVEPGGPVRVATSARHVQSTPATRADRTLDAATEASLFAHYGLLEDTPTHGAAPVTYGTGHVVPSGQPTTTLATGRAAAPAPGGSTAR